MAVSVTAHRATSVSIQRHTSGTSNARWMSFEFKDADGKEILDVAVFHHEVVNLEQIILEDD